jgi:hypothetical protein
MIKNDPIINKIAHGDAIEDLAKQRNISISEAKEEFTRMSFLEYHRLISEAGSAITPPSGNTIGPTGSTGTVQKPAQAAAGPEQMKAIWPGKGAPIEMGMTVGMKGPNGLPVPGTVSQVDQGANGVKVKNPTTGADEWMNMDTLEPFMTQGQPGTAPPAGQQPTQEGADIQRLRELAGLPESCSGGASGAGGIAVAAKPMGGVQRRQPAEEALKKEYTPKVAKTVVGDTKPAQASGQLSSTLAANGSKTASRINNGFKR